MWRLKFFLDPIGQLQPWLNRQAQAGYRLTQVTLCFYKFEKSNTDHCYSVQYLGCNSPTDNQQYLHLLAEANIKTFRAPLNQGNLAFGKIRFRPFAHGAGKFANSFQDYNHELIIVENPGTTPNALITIPQDLKNRYYDIRNTYLWGTIVTILLIALSIWLICTHTIGTNPLFLTITILCSIIVALLCGAFASFTLRAHRNLQHYQRQSTIYEG